ncbi:MAG: F0F1 ATP synthase subunit A [Butyricimonas faecihominis]
MCWKESKRYAPYLLTLFFFIFVSNMMGLIAVFPRGERDGKYVNHAGFGIMYFRGD